MKNRRVFKCEYDYKIIINYNKELKKLNLVSINKYSKNIQNFVLSRKDARELAKEILKLTTIRDKNLLFGDKNG